MASLLHNRFLLSPQSSSSSPSDRLHTSLIIGFTAGALSAALACLLFFCIHQCMFRVRRTRRDPPPPEPGPPSEVDAIPVAVYTKGSIGSNGEGGGENVCCSVCLEDYEGGEEVRVLPRCGHVFHKECIDRWITTGSRVCPICRGHVFEPESGGNGDGSLVRLHNGGLRPQQQLV